MNAEQYATNAAAACRAAQVALVNTVEAHDKAVVAMYPREIKAALVDVELHCMTAYRKSVIALRSAVAASEVSMRGNTHTCSATAEAAKACEYAARAATYSAAAFSKLQRTQQGGD
jgi:hypothetical protein